MKAEAIVEVVDQRCCVGGVLDFDTTRSAWDRIRPIIDQQQSLEIDLAGVTAANSAGLALLIECQAVAQSQNHTIRFSRIPDGLMQLAHVCEVDGLI